MRLEYIYSQIDINEGMFFDGKKPIISFEVFPPKEDVTNKNLAIVNEIRQLMQFNPRLVSVTYGAGGTTKANSLELARLIKRELKLDVMPHFTCKNSSKEFIENYLSEIEEECFENVLALRGDIPLGEEITCHDFKYANELVEFIKSKTNLSVGVAGYPEGHSESRDLDFDIENLKKKFDAGANAIYTQLFFDNTYFYNYCEKVQKAGINLPVIPGILPITSYNQLSKMILLCGVDVPSSLRSKLEKYKHDSNAVKEIGLDFAISQTQKLMDFGVPGMHFYILNKALPTFDILETLL